MAQTGRRGLVLTLVPLVLALFYVVSVMRASLLPTALQRDPEAARLAQEHTEYLEMDRVQALEWEDKGDMPTEKSTDAERDATFAAGVGQTSSSSAAQAPATNAATKAPLHFFTETPRPHARATPRAGSHGDTRSHLATTTPSSSSSGVAFSAESTRRKHAVRHESGKPNSAPVHRRPPPPPHAPTTLSSSSISISTTHGSRGGIRAPPRPVWLFPKTWWASGHHAREDPMQLLTPPLDNATCILQWSAEAEAEYKTFYRKVQHPFPASSSDTMPTARECAHMAETRAFVELGCAAWGLTSMMRDMGTWILRNLQDGRASLQRPDAAHLCKRYCNKARGTFDQHLGCFFVPLSACHSPYENHSGPPSRIDLNDRRSMFMRLFENSDLATLPQWPGWLQSGHVHYFDHLTANKRAATLSVTAHSNASTSKIEASSKEALSQAELKRTAATAVATTAAATAVDVDHSSLALAHSGRAPPAPNVPRPQHQQHQQHQHTAPLPPEPSRPLSMRFLNAATQMSFLRSMLAGLTWRAGPDVSKGVRALESRFGFNNNAGHAVQAHTPAWEALHPFVVLHARRTDKVNDDGLARSIREHFVGGQAPIRMYVDMIRTLEASVLGPGQQFKHVYVMSDDLEVWNQRALFGKRKVLANPFWTEGSMATLMNGPEWRKRGHGKLNVTGDNPGDDSLIFNFETQLLSDIYFAAKHADYIVGCGSSGVSQLMAQLMGYRERMDGTWLALWEEDYFAMLH